jgi:hypothetical protein
VPGARTAPPAEQRPGVSLATTLATTLARQTQSVATSAPGLRLTGVLGRNDPAGPAPQMTRDCNPPV